ncbi:MAG: hypothetical protein AAF921_21095 [Cyanobacteria bacterium P01_D01_bin.44]
MDKNIPTYPALRLISAKKRGSSHPVVIEITETTGLCSVFVEAIEVSQTIYGDVVDPPIVLSLLTVDFAIRQLQTIMKPHRQYSIIKTKP